MALPGNKNFSDYDDYITDQNPTTSAQAQDYFRNQAELLKAVIDCDFWQPETVYQPGDVVKSDSMPNGTEAVMVATKASVTSNVEPQWGAVGGANVSDGACFWKLRRKAVTVNGIEADNKGNIQIPVMQGSTNVVVGKEGLTPAPPASTDELFLSNNGEWKEAGKVKSVNGKTGDVTVGKIVDASISGKEITLTFADGTTKTLTTQDTVTATDIVDYIVESYRDGTEWYEVYKSGKVRQGGIISMKNGYGTATFAKAFADTDYFATCFPSTGRAGAGSFVAGISREASNGTRTTTYVQFGFAGNDYDPSKVCWFAEGQGA